MPSLLTPPPPPPTARRGHGLRFGHDAGVRQGNR